MSVFHTNLPAVQKKADFLYKKLKESPKGELSFTDLLSLFGRNPSYPAAKLHSEALHLLLKKEDVKQCKDRKGRNGIKLV